MEYDKEDFKEMIKDWKADNSPEMDDLEVIEIEFLEDTQEWCAVAEDAKSSYSLTMMDWEILLSIILEHVNRGLQPFRL